MIIKILDAKTLGYVPEIKKIEEFGNVEVFDTTHSDEVAERIRGAEIVITNKVVIGRREIASSPNLKLICVAATGMNNIDREAAAEAGIVVKNVKGYSSQSVAEHTFSLVLGLLHQTRYYDHYVKSPDGYAQSDIFTHLDRPFTQLSNMKAGIIGLGAIGSRVAELFRCFGAEVVYYSTSGKNTNREYQQVELEGLLSGCDIISIHAPLNEHTKDLIGSDEFRIMKKTAIIINTGRGGIINEKDLATALNEGEIAGAGIDVFEEEPISSKNPLLHLDRPERLLASPHIAWTSVEARKNLVDGIIGNIREFLA